MKIVVIYVYPVFGDEHDLMAARFVCCYLQRFPEIPHELIVVSNGGEPNEVMRETFKDVECRFIVHDDKAWDIGAYLKAAKEVPCDLMVFFGGSSYVRHARWLERMVEAFEKHGNALYGTMGNGGDGGYVHPHVRTTGFWLPPSMMISYPHPVTSERDSRYAFEHGPNCLSWWVMRHGWKVWMVHLEKEYELSTWPTLPPALFNVSRDEIFIRDRLSETVV